MFFRLYLISLLLIKEALFSASSNVEVTLLSKLMKDYDKSVRPVREENDVMNLTITINSLSLLNMDQAAETIVFSAEFIAEWKDAFLNWKPSEYQNVTWIKMKETQIWKPDITLSSAIDKVELLEEKDRYVDVQNDGLIRLSVFGVYTNLCNMQVDRFPYDSQRCVITIGPWSYTADEILCIPGQIFVSKEDFNGNSEWEFENISNQLIHTEDPDVGFKYTVTHFILVLKRKPLFYVWVLLIPTFIITTTCICGLFSPTNNIGDREEKVNLGVTTLLSSTVILEIIANSMPKTSALPLLGNFILAEIFVVAIGVVFAVFVLFLHNKAFTRNWIPPNWILAMLRISGSRKYLTKKSKTIKTSKSSVHSSATVKFVGDGTEFFTAMNSALNDLTSTIKEEEISRNRELAWLKFFDRLDFLLLVLFQTVNAIITYVICS